MLLRIISEKLCNEKFYMAKYPVPKSKKPLANVTEFEKSPAPTIIRKWQADYSLPDERTH